MSHSESDLIARVWPTKHLPGTKLSFLYSEWGQLVYASEGAITVETPEGVWVVPPNRAVWVPPNTEHTVTVHGGTTLRSIYLREDWRTGRSCTLGLTPLARELVLHIAATAPLRCSVPEHRRLVSVLMDQLRELAVLPVYLPQPRREVAVRAAVLLHKLDQEPDEVAKHVGVSLKTLERIFKAETGLTLGAWRQQAKLLEALRLLAQGEPVGNVAFKIGYSNDSAFIYAFRKQFGVSPGVFFGRLPS